MRDYLSLVSNLKRGVLGISSGADSSFLLQLFLLCNIRVVLAHINYQIRSEASEEEEYLRSFASQHSLDIEVLHAPKIYQGNFQDFARKIRYDFYEKVAKKYQLDTVYVAHQQDDVIETYLLQSKRHHFFDYYGIKPETTYKTVKIIRPILTVSKKEIYDYLLSNKIKYFEDSSNATDKYQRNYLRHHVISDSSFNREQILIEIENKNKEAIQKNSEIDSLINEIYAANTIREEAFDIVTDKYRFISRLLQTKFNIYISNKFVNRIVNDIANKRLNLKYKGIVLNQYDGLIYFIDDNIDQPKSMILYEGGEVYFHSYHFSFNGDHCLDSILLDREDFPLLLRTYQNGDKILLKDGKHKLLKKFYIDNKIEVYLRRRIPIVINKEGLIVFIPLYYHLRKAGKIELFVS